jgi:hypothetical protein
MDRKIDDPKVAAAFNAFSPEVQEKLMQLRTLIRIKNNR